MISESEWFTSSIIVHEPPHRGLLLSYRKSVQKSGGLRIGSSPRCSEEKKASVARVRVSADRPMQCRNCIGVLDRIARSGSVPFFAAFLVGLWCKINGAFFSLPPLSWGRSSALCIAVTRSAVPRSSGRTYPSLIAVPAGIWCIRIHFVALRPLHPFLFAERIHPEFFSSRLTRDYTLTLHVYDIELVTFWAN